MEEQKETNQIINENAKLKNSNFIKNILFLIAVFFTVFFANIFTIWILSFNAPILKPLLSFDAAINNIAEKRENGMKEKENRTIEKENVKMENPLKKHEREKCKENLRVIIGAVEMYNMDLGDTMKDLNLQILKDKGYIKKYFPSYPTGCRYCSIGDLTKAGDIKCEIHGGLFDK